MIEITAPNRPVFRMLLKPSVFLAGSIEMDRCDNWQQYVLSAVKDVEGVAFNPRRPVWDSTWSAEDERMKEQIRWELEYLDVADIVLMYFDPTTQSPISLFELGMRLEAGYHSNRQTLVVVCPQGFWRKANVDITCEWYGVQVFQSLEDGIFRLTLELEKENALRRERRPEDAISGEVK